ncbi:Mur ligase family protein [Psychrobacillus soli]|uniref:UDP-N-acetylmuramoyl-tripeptide--D-alanyl-D-alanine ligase n=1 Tax=Psychrobacillus soli TaxID=1543965 RepID=A0A544SIU9_9BACI|nr:Mur ligase family protein [Psychrobacillus soli]TQR05124.1 UDP-N-acetylmuramoyl-tripeptide--D-alanyl-D-alanine ligase [Psychrobacillus soli]
MKPHPVSFIRTIISGELVQGSDEVTVHYGAYRLKQIKRENTILFTDKRIIDWRSLKKFFPLVLATEWKYNKDEIPENVTVIQVTNADEAYWKFVRYYRSKFQIPVVAITGTSGKTTTKEMIKHILSADRIVTATSLTSNSRTANLQYLLNIDEETDAAVFETAVGAPGDVLNAGEYFKPTIGIITNIGAHHLNYCKTLEGYIEAKGEMVKIINPTGVLIINRDDSNTSKIDLESFRGKIIKIGTHSTCHFRARNIQYAQDGMQFSIKHKKRNYQMYVPGFGVHQVYNALAAIAAVYEMGVTIPEAAHHLKTFRKFNKQLQVVDGINDSVIIDDTWSITTTSLEAALKVLNEVGKDKKKIAIIGTITDLGSWGYTIHEQAGELIYQIGVDVLITIGEHASIMADHAVKRGLTSPVYTFRNEVLVLNLLNKIVDANTIVLIKGDMYSQPIIELASKLRKKK